MQKITQNSQTNTLPNGIDKIDTQINGLGEIEGIQKLYVEHTAAAMSKQQLLKCIVGKL